MRKEKNKAEFKKGSVQLQPGWARQGEKVVAWTTELQTHWSSPEGTRGGCPASSSTGPPRAGPQALIPLPHLQNEQDNSKAPSNPGILQGKCCLVP